MGRTGKSKVSRKVLAGMSQNPEMTDRALSTKISVKSSTASTARMRLKEMGAYRVINIPNFLRLSPGGVSVEYGKYKYHFPRSFRENSQDMLAPSSRTFFFTSDTMAWFSVGAIPEKRSPLQRNMAKSSEEARYAESITFEKGRGEFTAEDTIIWRYFNYAPLITKILLPDSDMPLQIVSPEKGRMKLEENEKPVFQQLVSEPEESDLKISHNIGISHPTFSKIRKRLQEEKLIVKAIQPSLEFLEIQAMCFTHINIHGIEAPSAIAKVCSSPNNFLALQNHNSIVLAALFTEESELNQWENMVSNTMCSSELPMDRIHSQRYFTSTNDFISCFKLEEAARHITGIEEQQEVQRPPIKELREVLGDFELLAKDGGITHFIETRMPVGNTDPDKAESIILELLTDTKIISGLGHEDMLHLQNRLISILKNTRSPSGKGMERYGAARRGVLLVEDMGIKTRLLEESIMGTKFWVYGIAHDSEETRTLLQENAEMKPGIIIVDVSSKSFPGEKIIEEIRENNPECRILAFGSSPNPSTEEKMKALGAKEYLKKPASKKKLIETLEKTMGGEE